jgi:hypothetical protein
MGLEMSYQKHTRFLEWFKPSEHKTIRPLFLYCSWKNLSTKLEEACASVRVLELS